MDIKRFMNTKFIKRTEDCKVPELKEYFKDAKSAIFKLQGLTGEDLAQVNGAVDKHKNLAQMLEKFLSDDARERIDAIKESMGITEKTPADFVRRLEMFVRGVVSPKPDMNFAVKLAKEFPITFYDITNKISQLTGRGSMPGKSKPSGGNKK